MALDKDGCWVNDRNHRTPPAPTMILDENGYYLATFREEDWLEDETEPEPEIEPVPVADAKARGKTA